MTDGQPSNDSRSFSLKRLATQNPGLAALHLWQENPSIERETPIWLHLGCGARLFDDFVNLDICPQDQRVIRWDLTGIWPENLADVAEGAFSEDCLEHLFYGEQVYALCNINRALKNGTTARILMPSLPRLVQFGDDLEKAGRSWDGLTTSADAVNYGMRFTGHRWLHDDKSFSAMAELCGFTATPTSCAKSTIEKLSDLALRDETNSASFATDLRKAKHISRVIVRPKEVSGALQIEDVTDDCALFVSVERQPVIEYQLPEEIPLEKVVCINIRSSNLSCFDWCLKHLSLNDEERQWHFDETLKSQPCMNVATASQLKQIGAGAISKLSFIPAGAPEEYFTLGNAEIFVLN